MDQKNSYHLNEDQIFFSVINEAGIPSDLHNHLLTCAQCRIEKEKIENDLNLLGREALRLTPSPVKKAYLPTLILHGRHNRTPNRRLVFGLAAAVFLLAILYLPAIHYYTPYSDVQTVEQEEWENDPLVAEVEELSENALPEVYLDISGNLYPVMDDEFIQSVIPPLTDTDISYFSTIKGVFQC